jgi:hypothetical protein
MFSFAHQAPHPRTRMTVCRRLVPSFLACCTATGKLLRLRLEHWPAAQPRENCYARASSAGVLHSCGETVAFRTASAGQLRENLHRGKAKRITEQERKLLTRRQAIEPIIGHLKSEHRLGRCHLKGEQGDRLHAVLCVPATTSGGCCA